MKENSIKKAEKILSSIDSKKLNEGMERIKNMSDAENAKLKKQLENIDKDKLLGMISSLNPTQVKEKLSKLDFSKLDALVKDKETLSKIIKDKKTR